jgi:micrococcal nuclease
LAFGTGSEFGAPHLTNFLVVLSRHFPVAAGVGALHFEASTNFPPSRHLPLASSAGAASALEATSANMEISAKVRSIRSSPDVTYPRSNRMKLAASRDVRVSTRTSIAAVIIGIGLTIGGAARADPCEAIPRDGPLPSYLHRGAEFSGPVSYVGDGDSLCVAVGADATEWVEVRLADFYAPELQDLAGKEAKAQLSSIALGRTVTCTVGNRTWDRVAARCTLRGVSLGDRMRAAGVAEGGRGQTAPTRRVFRGY